MPTLPSSPPSDREPHQVRDLAESFGSDPDRYDRTRPRYPDALIDRLATVEAADAPDGRDVLDVLDVLDVGCGTGIVARQLGAAGCRVLGVEVDPRMADFARRHGVEVEVSAFESWDPAGRAFDAVVAGQTWHWIDPVAGAAKAADALRPGGRLAVFWNVAQPPPEVASATSAVYARHVRELPAVPPTLSAADGYAPLLDRATDGVRRCAAFDDPLRWHFEWEQRYTRDAWLDQLPTAAIYGRLSPAARRETAAELGAAIDTLGGAFTMRYTTVAITARLVRPPAR